MPLIKQCDFCSETIPAEDMLCKHCGIEVEKKVKIASSLKKIASSLKKWIINPLLLIILFGIIGVNILDVSDVKITPVKRENKISTSVTKPVEEPVKKVEEPPTKKVEKSPAKKLVKLQWVKGKHATYSEHSDGYHYSCFYSTGLEEGWRLNIARPNYIKGYMNNSKSECLKKAQRIADERTR